MIEAIEGIHYVSFVINVTWTMMNYIDISGEIIYIATFVMLMDFIITIVVMNILKIILDVNIIYVKKQAVPKNNLPVFSALK